MNAYDEMTDRKDVKTQKKESNNLQTLSTNIIESHV